MISHQDLPRAVPQSISRLFLRQALPTVAGLGIGSSLLRSLLGDRTLLAEAAEVSRETVTVDLHRHPNALAGPHFLAKSSALIPAALLKRGYPDVAIARIIGGNFMKLFREVTEGAG